MGFEPEVVTAINPSRRVHGSKDWRPKGFLYHATHSTNGENDHHEEFVGTVNFVRGGAGGLGWHATVGDGEIAVHMGKSEWGYHAREFSEDWVGIEFAKATLEGEITDDQIRTALWYCRKYWPELDPSCFVFHSEIPPGVRDGKVDPYVNRSPELASLRRRILGMIL